MFRKIFNRGQKTDLSGGMPSRVTVKTELPPAPTVPNTTQVDKDQVDKDKKTDHQTTDDEIAKDAGKDDADTRAAKTDISKDKGVTQNQHKTATSGVTDKTIAGEYQSFWEQELDVRLEEETLDEINYYSPSAIPMMRILRITGRFTSSNTQMLKYFPTYCHYATLIYYSVLFYIQILRARRQADAITGVERKFLKRFEATYKPEALPIAGQLFPFFSTIIATQIADGKYDWVVPQIVPGIFYATMDAFAPGDGGCYLQPMVPYMVGLLRLYIMRSFRTEAQGNQTQYFDDDDNAVPFVPSPGLHPAVFGMDLHRGTATDPDDVLLPYCLGVNEPNFISNDVLTDATRKWSSSKFSQIRFAARRPANTTNSYDLKATTTDGTTAINSLARFLCMIEEEDMEWFDFCVEHATIQAKFSKKVYNLSNVPTVGGNEVLILATFKRRVGANRAATAPFADTRLGINENNFNWHQDLFEGMTASFTTDRANYDREEELQALTFATNCTLPITTAGNSRVGNSTGQRTGSYFTNPERARATHRDGDDLAFGKQMFARWNEIIIEKMMSAKPSSL
ncbi:coat protein [Rhizoctonia oryzae-sativae partitivirus 5]|nr:coat protein [Rhizoctonia oryzae-sativae partitivirus 5]